MYIDKGTINLLKNKTAAASNYSIALCKWFLWNDTNFFWNNFFPQAFSLKTNVTNVDSNVDTNVDSRINLLFIL